MPFMRSSSCVGPTRLPVCVLFLGMAIFGGLTSWFVARADWGAERLR